MSRSSTKKVGATKVAEEWITIGEITAPQGIRGEVRVFPISDTPNRLLALKTCHVRMKDNAITSYTILSVRPHKGCYLMRLEGVDTRNAAEALRGSQLVVPRSEVAPLPEGRYYIFDLVGMQVFTAQGETIGILSEVLCGPANDVYVVRRKGKPDLLVPAIRQVVTAVDVAARRMTITPIPGLLEDEEEDGSHED